ncbi:unnamed protein product [Diatraea saccharalis]|uniref:MARVEL domain-containing protein n=1 Tax=Diatraea saccharalis TaxID=40085 RepID=A0A9N9WC25_9NEOP|nr:unnamed protein product [Diatraea saccharalis]
MTYPNQPLPPAPVQSMGSANTVFITEIRFDLTYMKTPEGVLKIIIIVLSLIGFICIQSSAFWSNGRGVYFNIVANLAFWSAGCLILCYLFHVVEKYHNIKWLKIELVVDVVLVFLYVIASTIVVAFGSAAYSAAGFFGYLTMVSCGADAFLKGRALKAGRLPQGQRVVAKQPHVLTPPALT